MITDEYLAENTDFKSAEELAKAIIENDYKMKDLEKGKPIFRLHPPVKGYEGNKRSYKNGGALGYRGEAINALIARML
jgi:large subunit ribosomal protein L30